MSKYDRSQTDPRRGYHSDGGGRNRSDAYKPTGKPVLPPYPTDERLTKEVNRRRDRDFNDQEPYRDPNKQEPYREPSKHEQHRDPKSDRYSRSHSEDSLNRSGSTARRSDLSDAKPRIDDDGGKKNIVKSQPPRHQGNGREREVGHRDRDHERDRDRDYDRGRDRDYDRDRGRERDYDRDRGHDRDYDRSHDRDYGRDRGREHDRNHDERDRNHENDRKDRHYRKSMDDHDYPEEKFEKKVQPYEATTLIETYDEPPRIHEQKEVPVSSANFRPIYHKNLALCFGIVQLLFSLCFIALGVAAVALFSFVLALAPWITAVACIVIGIAGIHSYRQHTKKAMYIITAVVTVAGMVLWTALGVFAYLCGMYVGNRGYQYNYRRTEVSIISIAALCITIPAIIIGSLQVWIGSLVTCCITAPRPKEYRADGVRYKP